MQEKVPVVYMTANKKNGTIYTGVTSDLQSRNYQHKSEIFKGFTSKYDCKILVYYEVCGDMENAILREKQLKVGSRKKKIQLIEKDNVNWKDLSHLIA